VTSQRSLQQLKADSRMGSGDENGVDQLRIEKEEMQGTHPKQVKIMSKKQS